MFRPQISWILVFYIVWPPWLCSAVLWGCHEIHAIPGDPASPATPAPGEHSWHRAGLAVAFARCHCSSNSSKGWSVPTARCDHGAGQQQPQFTPAVFYSFLEKWNETEGELFSVSYFDVLGNTFLLLVRILCTCYLAVLGDNAWMPHPGVVCCVSGSADSV